MFIFLKIVLFLYHFKISALSKVYFFLIRNLKRIRSCLSRGTATSIANAFTQFYLDYCNNVYTLTYPNAQYLSSVPAF
jgi:hypothetical protein